MPRNTAELKTKLAVKANGDQMIQTKQPATLKGLVMEMAPQIEKALPKTITTDRFTRIVLTALSSTPQLASCERNSFLGALMQAAQLGLEPNTPLGQAYLIPYKNYKKGITECQFQIGYHGLLDLAYRSGSIQTVQAHVVYENDEFDYELGLDEKLFHKPALINRGEPIAVYALFKAVNGGHGFEVMSMEDIRNHAKKFSKSFENGPWKTNFEEMAKKTVIKRLLKYAPLKSEFLQAMNTDETILKADEKNLEHIDVEYVVTEQEFPDESPALNETEGETADV